MWFLIALALALATVAARPGPASADATQTTILQDDPLLTVNPTGTLELLRQMGVDQVRVAMRWGGVAPDAGSHRAPKNFAAANPASYSASAWAPYDAIVRAASAAGVEVDFNVSGGAPLWATGPGEPTHQNWEPSAPAFGQFVRALGTRYSGDYDPQTKRQDPGNPADLPRVSFWSIWNEPDYGPGLAPQALPGHPGVPDSPRMYRALVDAAWSALQDTGHRSDGILIGELAPRAAGTKFGNFNGMLPTVFLRNLYCLGANGRPLRGALATLEGCPRTTAGTDAFRRQNPALFDATGISDHPYMRWYPPDDEEDSPKVKDFSSLVKQYTTLATIGNLQSALRRDLGAYGSHRAFPIWNTEFGYITSPPKRRTKKDPYPWVNQATAALYDNWAEYISWKNPQIQSFDQYLLQDPLPALPTNGYGSFASGLINYDGTPKPGFAAFRMPVFMPRTTATSSEAPLEVWGAVHPVLVARSEDPGASQDVQILFRATGQTHFAPLATVAVTSAEGYWDTRVRFPGSGTLQTAWTYPSLSGGSGQTVYSRPVQVTVR